jgi:hypothetical protein
MLQFYSPQDELTALREIRMMDAGSGYNTGSGTLEDGGTMISLGSNIRIFSTQTLITRMLSLSRYIHDSYNEIEKDVSLENNHPIYEIWPEAIQYMKDGMSMSDILDKSSEEEILEALRKFETNLQS